MNSTPRNREANLGVSENPLATNFVTFTALDAQRESWKKELLKLGTSEIQISCT